MQNYLGLIKYVPLSIWADPAFLGLTDNGRMILGLMYRCSYLTKKNPKRRYVNVTNNFIAPRVGCSESTCKRQIKKILKSKLALRWFCGKGCLSRYELPASRKQLLFWRINCHGPKKED